MIYRRLTDEFTDAELDAIAFEMGYEGEQVWSSDDAHGARAIKLIRHVVMRDRLDVLLAIVERERPRKGNA